MANQNEPLCILTDCLRPVSLRKGGEEIPIHSIQQLVDTLRKFTLEKPRVLNIGMPKGRPQLVIGMSWDLAAVDLYPFFSTGRSWFAKPQVRYSSKDMWITDEGEPSWFPGWAMMPVGDVIQFVAYIVEHNDLPDKSEWVNLNGQRLLSLNEDADVAGAPQLMPPPP